MIYSHTLAAGAGGKLMVQRYSNGTRIGLASSHYVEAPVLLLRPLLVSQGLSSLVTMLAISLIFFVTRYASLAISLKF